MTKAPERAVLHESPHEIEKGFQGWWHIDDGANGTGLGWYVPEDHALALVAAAYEDAANLVGVTCKLISSVGYTMFADRVGEMVPHLRARTPDDATAALERLKQEARNDGLRKAVDILRTRWASTSAEHEKEILALITEGQSDGE